MINKGRVGLGLIAAAIVAAGCTEKQQQAEQGTGQPAKVAAEAPKAAEVLTPEVRAEAAEIFSSRCTPCHGPKGGGDGPASAGLMPRPANLSNPAWQKSVTDEHIEKIVAYGGAAVGKSPAMPPNPDLADQPVVKGLREHIRSLSSNP
jgi:mono/diheme cytochrome c family protein